MAAAAGAADAAIRRLTHGWGKLVRITGCCTAKNIWAICPATAHYTSIRLTASYTE